MAESMNGPLFRRIALCAAWCGALPGLVGLGMLLAWLVRPRHELLEFAFFIYMLPTLALWALGWVLAAVAWLGSRVEPCTALRVLALDVLLGFALLAFMGRISVSEVRVENRSGQELREVVVTCEGDRFEIHGLGHGVAEQRPLVPTNEGSLVLEATALDGATWHTTTFAYECCPSEFRLTIEADGSVTIAERDLR